MNLSHDPSDEEFQAIRDRLALRDAEKAREGLELDERVLELVEVIKHHPEAMRRALFGDVCPECGLVPCGCERQWKP
jgi:hypothetical protein